MSNVLQITSEEVFFHEKRQCGIKILLDPRKVANKQCLMRRETTGRIWIVRNIHVQCSMCCSWIQITSHKANFLRYYWLIKIDLLANIMLNHNTKKQNKRCVTHYSHHVYSIVITQLQCAMRCPHCLLNWSINTQW